MTTRTKNELLEVFREEYRGATAKRKTELLDAFTQASKLSRKHAITRLGEKPVDKRPAQKRGKRPDYDDTDRALLVRIWHLASCICSKRLIPFIPELLKQLSQSGHPIPDHSRKALLKMSARTADRLLKEERRRLGRSIGTTKKGGLLKHQIPIHTFSDWNDVKPGFFEADTVSHCDSSVAGKFISSLNLTDVATGWTEPIAIPNKTADDVVVGLDAIRHRIPFPMQGLDSDNGKEFINESVIEWCKHNCITFTRSREYKKNDQAWIEEKNRSVVRRHVGRSRFEGKSASDAMNAYYLKLRLYINFFQPCQKLIFKERTGSKTYKRYDVAKTPYQRVLESEHVTLAQKTALTELMNGLSMVALHEELYSLGEKLRDFAIYPPMPFASALASQRMSTFKFVSRADNAPNATVEISRCKTKPVDMMYKMRTRIMTYACGHVFRAADFCDIAPRPTVDVYLRKLVDRKQLCRIGWGRYEKIVDKSSTY